MAALATPSISLAAPAQQYRIPLKTAASEGQGALELSPAVMDFGSVAVSQTRHAQATLTNTGDSPVRGIQAGTDAPFSVDASDCAALAAGASCRLLVSFSPAQRGTAAGELRVTSSAGSPTGQLYGNGAMLLTDIEVSSDLWYFGNWPLGESSDTRQLVLHNKGNKPFTFAQLGLVAGGSDYKLESECGSTLAADGYCTVKATFTPTTKGLRMGAFRIQGSDGSLRDVNMVGYGGMGSVPGARLSIASALNFGEIDIGTTPEPHTLTITNIGTEPVDVAKPTLVGVDAAAFAVQSSCPDQIRPWSSCTMSISAPGLAAEARRYVAKVVMATSEGQNSSREVDVYAHVVRAVDAKLVAEPAQLRLDAAELGKSVKGIVKLKNQGPNPTTITRAFAANAQLFTADSRCANELAAGDTCEVEVTFTPRAAGVSPGTLEVGTSADQTLLVPLSGLLPVPKIRVSPSLVNFKDAMVVGTTSAPVRVEVSNQGSGPLRVDGISTADVTLEGASDLFGQSNSCGATLEAGDSCFVDVAFKPKAAGVARGALVVASNDPVSPSVVVWMDAQGTEGVTSVQLTPEALNFGNVPVGQSLRYSMAVRNNGSLATQVTGVAISNDDAGVFDQANGCGALLPPGASCAVTVSFQAKALEAYAAGLTLTLADGQSREVPLAGQGADTSVKPALVVLPGSLDLGNATVGRFAASGEVRLRNTGTGPLRISGISVLDQDGAAVSQEFNQSNNCGDAIPSQVECTLKVSFLPKTPGARAGNIAIQSNDPTNALTFVPVRGTGLAGRVSLSPVWGMTFPNLRVGESHTMQAALSNDSTQPVVVTGIGIADQQSPFTQVNACGDVVSPGGSCAISITFEPQQVGLVYETLTVVTNDGSVLGLSMKGEAIAGTPEQPPVQRTGIYVSPSPVDFGQVKTKVTTSLPVTITNYTAESQTLLGVQSGNPSFSAATSCVGVLSAGKSCTFSASVRPDANGLYQADLSFTFAKSSLNLATRLIAAASTDVVPPSVSLSASSLDFGLVSPSAPQVRTVQLSNTGTSRVYFRDLALSQTGTDISVVNGCADGIAPSASCNIDLTFRGTTFGPATGRLVISPIGGNVMEVLLAGAGTEPVVKVNPTQISFPATGTASRSPYQTVTVTNEGTRAMSVFNIVASNQFEATHNCPATLAVGASCEAQVRFAPTEVRSPDTTGYLAVSSDARVSTTGVVALSGKAGGPVLGYSPDSLTFADQPMGGFETKLVHVTNSGLGTAVMQNIATLGENSGFSVNSTCPGALASGQSCDISVRFSPVAGGVHSTSLVVAHDGTTDQIALSGNGPPAHLGLLFPTTTFPPQALKVESIEQVVTVVNTGTVPARVYEATLPQGSPFKLARFDCTAALQPEESCSLFVTFTPTALPTVSDVLTIRSANNGGNLTATLTGSGVSPSAQLSPGSLNFGAMYTGKLKTLSANLTNTSAYPLLVESVTSNSAHFTGKQNCTNPVAPGTACEIVVSAHPVAGGTQAGVVTVNTTGGAYQVNNSVQATQVTLTGVTPGELPTTGGKVSLTGTGFGPSPKVLFGGVEATNVRVLGSTQIEVTAPAHAPGEVAVSVLEGDAPAVSIAKAVKYVPGATLTSIAPNKGGAIGNWEAVLSGESLACGMTVLVEGKAATIRDCGSSNQLTIVVPPRAFNASGLVDVTVRNGGGESTLRGGLEYVQDAAKLVFRNMGDFGNVLRNATTQRMVSLVNEGTLPAQMRSVGVSGSGFRVIPGGTCPTTLPTTMSPKQACTMNIEISGSDGVATGVLRVNAGAQDEASLALRAEFVQPNFVFSSLVNSTVAPMAAFDPVAALHAVGKGFSPTSQPMTVYFNNVGLIAGAKLQGASLTVSGPQAAMFRVTAVRKVANTGAGSATGTLATDGRSATNISTDDGAGTAPHLQLSLEYRPTVGSTEADVAQIRLDYGDGNFALLPLVGTAVYDATAYLSGAANADTPVGADFGQVTYNPSQAATPVARTFYVRNASKVAASAIQVTRYSIVGTGDDAKAFTLTCASGKVSDQDCRPTSMIQTAAANGLAIPVQFLPKRIGEYRARLIIEHSGINEGGVLTLDLVGSSVRDVALEASQGAYASKQTIAPFVNADGSAMPTNMTNQPRVVFVRNTGTAGRVAFTGVQIEGSPAFTLRQTALANRAASTTLSGATLHAFVRFASISLVGADVATATSGYASDLGMELYFKPTTAGSHRATVTVFHDGPGGQTSFEVQGEAVNMGVLSVRGVVDFGTVDPAAETASTIVPEFYQPSVYSAVRIESMQLTGRDADQFVITKVDQRNPAGSGAATVWWSDTNGARTVALNRQLDSGSSFSGSGSVTIQYRPTRDGNHSATLTIKHSGEAAVTTAAISGRVSMNFADLKALSGTVSLSNNNLTAALLPNNQYQASGVYAGYRIGPRAGRWYAEFTTPQEVTNWAALAIGMTYNSYKSANTWYNSGNSTVDLQTGTITSAGGAAVYGTTRLTFPQGNMKSGDRLAMAADVSNGTVDWYHYQATTGNCSHLGQTLLPYKGYPLAIGATGMRPTNSQYVELTDGAKGNYACPMPAGYSPWPNAPSAATGQ
ncbi:IPT/TIG domain protein [compost metagenome]